MSRAVHRPAGDDPSDLLTERYRPELADIDLASTAELVALMVDGDKLVPAAVERAGESIVTAIDAVADRLERGGRLIYAGAGTAGRLGVLDAAECRPTFSTEPGQVVGLLAGGEGAFGVSVDHAEDDEQGGAAAIHALGVGPTDAVVGISASGRTPYVLGVVERARALGAATVGLSCNPDAILSGRVDHPVEVVVGPELIAGSTRLKSGTAQKLVLNMISTISMIRLGKTYGNLMVEVRPTNEKLRLRAARIVREATGAGEAAAKQVLAAADDDVKTAILMILRDLDAPEARRRLTQTGERVRAALELEP